MRSRHTRPAYSSPWPPPGRGPHQADAGLNQPLEAADPAALNRWPVGPRPISITAAPARPAVRLRPDAAFKTRKLSLLHLISLTCKLAVTTAREDDMRTPKRNRGRTILIVALAVIFIVSAGQALVAGQGGAVAGLLLFGVFGVACFRAGSRRSQSRRSQAPQAPAPQAPPRAPQAPRSQAPRSAGGRRPQLGGRIVRDAVRLLISRH